MGISHCYLLFMCLLFMYLLSGETVVAFLVLEGSTGKLRRDFL